LRQVAYGEDIKQGTAAKYEILTDNNEARNAVQLEILKARLQPQQTGGQDNGMQGKER
jgi:hypothetical protein